MRGEEEVARDQFGHDAADRPHISDLIPLAALQDDLRGTVLPRADDGAVWLVEERRPSEIDDPHATALGQPVGVPPRGVFNQFLLLQQNVLRLEVSVGVA